MKIFRSDIITEDFILKVLSNCHKNSANIKVVQFTSEPGTSKGDNFLGELASVKVVAKVTTKDGKDEDVNHHWMVKMMKPDLVHGAPNIGRILGAFDREMKIYEEILPALEKISSISSCPMIFVDGTHNEEVLVLEHMRQHKWGDAKQKKKGLTLEYVNLVIDWLANFHGLSHIMMEQYPGGKQEYIKDHPWIIPQSQNPSKDLEKFGKKIMEDQKIMFFKLAEILEDGDSTRGYVKFLKDLQDKGVWADDVRKVLNKPREPFSTINHLDPWFNNMLFQHDEDGRPTKVLLLDFQLASYTHPGNDLAHFLLTSTLPTLRAEYLDQILLRYHEKLHQVVGDAGLKLQYSIEDLKEDYRIGQAIGFVFCLFVLPVVLSEPDDTGDFTNVDYNDEIEFTKFRENHQKNVERIIESDPELKHRIGEIFQDMIRANVSNII